MTSLEKIVCPIDFSQFSVRALRLAGEWAEHFEAELWLVHVLEPSSEEFLRLIDANISAEGFEKAREIQSAWNLRMTAQSMVSSAVRVHTVVRFGDPASEIIKAAESLDAGLIVMATHGSRGWQSLLSGEGWHHLMMGSVALAVTRRSPCPVLIMSAAGCIERRLHAEYNGNSTLRLSPVS